MNRRILKNNLLVLALGGAAVLMQSQKSDAQVPQCVVYPSQECGQCLAPFYLQYQACIAAGVDPNLCNAYTEPGINYCFASGACHCQ